MAVKILNRIYIERSIATSCHVFLPAIDRLLSILFSTTIFLKRNHMAKTQPTCQERIDEELVASLDDLRLLWGAFQTNEEYVDDLGSFLEYHLSFDYVDSGNYWRYQISWGGPASEYRFYYNSEDPEKDRITRVEYWFYNWFDSACRVITGKDKELLLEVFNFHRCGRSWKRMY